MSLHQAHKGEGLQKFAVIQTEIVRETSDVMTHISGYVSTTGRMSQCAMLQHVGEMHCKKCL